MKIFYLTDQTYLHGGIEKVLSQKANYFADVHGDEVTIVTYNQQGRDAVYPLSEKIKRVDLGINYETGISYFHPANLKKILKHRHALKKILKEIQPEVVISCSFGPDFYFIPSLEKHIPKIKEFHASRFFDRSAGMKDMLLKFLGKHLEQKYDRLALLNPSEVRYYSGKISVIPNPAEFSDFRADWSSKKIIAAGRISPVKDFDSLIHVFSAVAAEFPDWELHFWGEDYLATQAKLEMLVHQYGLSDQIRFMGRTPDLKKEMQQYSIYAMTSETECFPMVLLESLSMGMPVISLDAPTGPKHIVTDNEDGFIVPYKNLDIFTEKLKQMMHDENLRRLMGKKGQENVRRFSSEKVMKQWKELFHQLLFSQPQP